MKTARFLALFAACTAAAETLLVDLIPPGQSREHRQQADANLAVDPANPDRLVVTCFGGVAGRHPAFFSHNGGFTWRQFERLDGADFSAAWGGDGRAYASVLGRSGKQFTIRAVDPLRRGARFAPLAASRVRGGQMVGQPWLAVSPFWGVDRLYAGFNDFNALPRSASVRQSLDGGKTWATVRLNRRAGAAGGDGPPVRVAARGQRAYAVFWRLATYSPELQLGAGDVVVVRDDLGGAGGWGALGEDGVTLHAGASFDFGFLGSERIGSDLSLAIDPTDPNRVAIAYAARVGADVTAHLAISHDAGATWVERFATVPRSALPAVAIAENGNVGLLYTRLEAGNLETHLRQWRPDFGASVDETLARFRDGFPAPEYSPYIGDSQDLEAHGPHFLGVFCASNDAAFFPRAPLFLREAFRLGGQVPHSLDPYFFRAAAIAFP